MPTTLLERRQTHFVLWRPAPPVSAPVLVIGQFQAGNPPTLADERRVALQQSSEFPDLWEIAATDCGLQDGQAYHYWFEVNDTDPARRPSGTQVPVRILCTDPFAHTTDWRLRAPALPPPYNDDDRAAVAVIRFSGSRLVTCDPDDGAVDFGDAGDPRTLPVNNRMVIYELPTAWAREAAGVERGVGTFRDVTALIEQGVSGANFAELAVVQLGRSYLTELGVNALELLPPADSFYFRQWGYGTTNFLAPDFELGLPEGFSFAAPNAELAELVRACHGHGIRFLIDWVMAFAQLGAYQRANFAAFHIDDPLHHQDDPDAFTSTRGFGVQQLRNGFGSTLFRYVGPVISGYDPVTGQTAATVSARQWMQVAVERWMTDFHVDGYRLDSVENVANWDFLQEFKDHARALARARWQTRGLDPAGAEARFLVVGEELSRPLELLTQKRLDGIWNEDFKQLIRAAFIGQNAATEPSFEWTVRKAIDCRLLGFADGSQAINYLTSHDVEGFRNERLFNFFMNNGVVDVEKRIKLAFVCLLTAVGIPQILAGDEFADQHDRFDSHGNVTQDGGKQVDPVNFNRLDDDWRHRIFTYVSRMIKFRISHPALSVNDTDFIFVDFSAGKRVLVWRRGSSQQDPVVVVANFSDFTTDTSHSGAEYFVPNWPATPSGRHWREVTQDRLVPPEWVGREPIFSWEAKAYTLA